MATLRDIRRKLQSVGNIKKITEAMELVAASRLRKAQAKAESSRPYARTLKAILDALITASDTYRHPLVSTRPIKKTGLVIVAGDRGLCGAYNQNIFNTAEQFLQRYATEAVEIIPVGRKPLEYFRTKHWNLFSAIEEWGGKISYPQIEAFTRLLIEGYLNGKLDDIWIIYTHFINTNSRQVRVEKFLNIEAVPRPEKEHASIYLFEPTPAEIFSEILPRYCVTQIQSALHDAYASELAARIASMRAATTNAEEMIEKLTLIRNKVRQSSITRELIEITSGAESLR